MTARILIIEDEEPLTLLLRYNLEAEGYSVESAVRGDEADLKLKENTPDLAVIDWMLPGLSGIELIRRLRARPETHQLPIIMLTARGEETERVRGLATGADDYIVKPFSVPELLARIRALLRRTKPERVAGVLSAGDIELDREKKRVARAGRDVPLGPTEFRLLEFLMENPGRVFSREQLLDRVWGRDVYIDERTVDVHVGRLRKALNRGRATDPIRTVRAAGYALNDRFVKRAAAAVASTMAVSAADISGAGATFPYPIYSKWADAYKKETGVGLNYQSIGSGGGIKQIHAKTVVFGATDAPLSGAELDKSGLVQFPMVMGGIVPVYNLPGIGPGELVIDGPTLGKIFLGQVKTWDDAALKKLNPNAKLPSQAIAVVHRSDGSGTTFNFTDYLSKVSPDWKSKVGSSTAVEWPMGIGAKGNEGVANNVANTKGSIGYVEYAYAKQNKLTYSKMINKDGKTVAPTSEAFQAAAANADWNSVPGYGVILSDQPGAQSWPITAATFILIHEQSKDQVAATEALKFFAWAYSKGGKMPEDLDFVPMPAPVVATVEKMWTANIKDPAGKPLFASSN